MLHMLREKTSWLTGILPALPHFCALCAQVSPQSLCPACLDRYFTRFTPRCRICAEKLPEKQPDPLCGACLKNPPSFDRIITAADYEPPVDQLVQSLKFGGKLALAPLFANLIAQAVLQAENLPLPDIIAPVPLAAQRLSERGFNQSLEIARRLSQQLHIPLIPTLVSRTRETAPQSLTAMAERRKNIRQAFAVGAPFRSRLNGRHIAIVDDVLTTGHTMGEIARILKQAGAETVSGFIFARTPL
ncbi:MAG: ComF family protein [Alistipes senegalensis]|nr:ComF family protein [Alistipes senegalensis]